MTSEPQTVESRALQSGGVSADAIYATVAETLRTRRSSGGILLDVGCGAGRLWPFLRDQFDQYVGADVLRYEDFTAESEFHQIDLDSGRVQIADGTADVVAAVETIEHLENPRAFARELTRLCRPGGWIVLTTPNQLSLLSKLTLVVKNRFNAFTDSCYPAHITALLEIDLLRIVSECGWCDVQVVYTQSGRIPGTARHWPRWVSAWRPRSFSDNICLVGRKRPSLAAGTAPSE